MFSTIKDESMGHFLRSGGQHFYIENHIVMTTNVALKILISQNTKYISTQRKFSKPIIMAILAVMKTG